MPEGPEIHFLAKFIKHNSNNVLVNIIARSKRKVRMDETYVIKKIYAHGKLIVFDCGNKYVHIHLGLAGWIQNVEGKYTKYVLEFSNKNKLFIDDSRKFSKIWLLNEKKHLKKIQKLGEDIMSKSYTLQYFYDNLVSGNKSLPAFLLDQSVNAGLGNYIKNEALYMAKISPYKKTGDLTYGDCVKLYKAILYVAYANYVTLMSEYGYKVNYKNVKVPYKFKVYEKDYDSYGNKVVYDVVNGRNTYFVPKLQI